MRIDISAPGSIMLMGEHAVLRGKNSIVCSVDARIKSTLRNQENQLISIDTELGSIITTTSK